MTPSNPSNSQPLIYRIMDALGVTHLVACINHTHEESEVNGLSNDITELWHSVNEKQEELTFDSTPTASSTNPVTSGGVLAAIDTNVSILPVIIGPSLPKISLDSLFDRTDIFQRTLLIINAQTTSINVDSNLFTDIPTGKSIFIPEIVPLIPSNKAMVVHLYRMSTGNFILTGSVSIFTLGQ